MKKTFLFTLLLAVAVVGFSQVRFGIKGGLNLAGQLLHVKTMGIDVSESGKTIPSFHIGFFGDIPLSENVKFDPEILFNGKGANFNALDNNGGNTETAKVRPYYLNVPLNLLYYHKLKSGNTALFIGGGPDFGYGLFGKVSNSDTSENVFQKDGFRRFDFGINFIGGVELTSGVRISINYTLGITSIVDNSAAAQAGVDSETWKNRVFSISVGYLFRAKK
ncbi:MAG TPA: porin family protein [Puia sp.]|nr:porin family protein [Puia sp.]